MSLALLLALPASAAGLVVEPYLQLATPTSIRVGWEAPGASPGVVVYGDGLEQGSTVVWTDGTTSIHEAELSGLTPGAAVAYRVESGGATSETFTLRTPPSDPTARTWRFVATSDMQRSDADPEKWGEITHDGVMSWVTENLGAGMSEALDGVLVPGDLVDDGENHEDWTRDFFGLQHPLFAEVPLYAVLGNHESNADWYFRYIQSPLDGEPDRPEHSWTHSLGNVRIIGLDSNDGYANDSQLRWLEDRLADACADPAVDFVFAQLHHPFQSELWTPGNHPWAGLVQAQLEAFSNRCGRPSVMFFGHTHAYSRGQSLDARHLMINVAAGGGAIDRWGEQAQRDEPAYTVSDDAWGWVLVEVEAGEDPTLRVRRFSRGDREQGLDNTLIDDLTLHRDAPAPAAPSPVAPHADAEIAGDCATFQIDAPATVQAVRWQLASACDAFDAPLLDRWVQDHNLYFGTDSLSDDDPLSLRLAGPLPPAATCWRAQVRDPELAWSAWSTPAPFRQVASTRTGNLLANPGAEDGVRAPWEGDTASITGDGRCSDRPPAAGARSFVLGGTCLDRSGGAMGQTVRLPAALQAGAPAIARAELWAVGEGQLTVRLTALDLGGAELGTTEAIFQPGATWAPSAVELDLPVTTTRVRLDLVGASGVIDLDELRLTVGEGGEVDCAPRRPAPDDTSPPAACGCASGPRTAPAPLLLAALALVRRRRA